MTAKARNLKIEAIGDFACRKIKPRIRLSGYWLERAGFKPGHRVVIHESKPGELTIRFTKHSLAN
jgi:3'-phosphoadenosine 5'-phosphosulfate sulfotransferase